MIMPKSDTVTMTRDACNDVSAYIDKLEKDLEFLNALKACGVDNWDGYSDAVEMVYGEDDE
ncbi:host RecBCD nuclease inhibitor [Yersinia phage vB_YenP_AP5]|uniref:Host recBCD nuclease inhibitor n=1 Tax=Yersinia phage vB_YenP_AP5 TaxID=1536611 RepID=A0A088F637_9CAUD|nr:host RecBCD nuclease inhibitor [Yersinia phage vB_YenP_AP5]AIM40368.1 host recBCD nuclease inhibitor [Yersinia phage vB_YenP_AP5]